ncbi:hypothetical protein J6590_025404 [Homalodisca vitripennis]|nr:hypothetical protein J6590_025404 [Homalodisca vitripennis]
MMETYLSEYVHQVVVTNAETNAKYHGNKYVTSHLTYDWQEIEKELGGIIDDLDILDQPEVWYLTQTRVVWEVVHSAAAAVTASTSHERDNLCQLCDWVCCQHDVTKYLSWTNREPKVGSLLAALHMTAALERALGNGPCALEQHLPAIPLFAWPFRLPAFLRSHLYRPKRQHEEESASTSQKSSPRTRARMYNTQHADIYVLPAHHLSLYGRKSSYMEHKPYKLLSTEIKTQKGKNLKMALKKWPILLMKNQPVPFLLKDLLQTEQLKLVFNKVPLILGSPKGFNLRNVLWHGFVTPGELSTDIVEGLVVLFASLGQELQYQVNNLD